MNQRPPAASNKPIDRDALLEQAMTAERAAIEAVRFGDYAGAVHAYGIATELYGQAGDLRQAWNTGLSAIQLFNGAPHLLAEVDSELIDAHFERFLDLGDAWANHCDDLERTARASMSEVGVLLGGFAREESFFEEASAFSQGCEAFFFGAETLAEHASAQARLSRESLGNVGRQYSAILAARDAARDTRGL